MLFTAPLCTGSCCTACTFLYEREGVSLPWRWCCLAAGGGSEFPFPHCYTGCGKGAAKSSKLADTLTPLFPPSMPMPGTSSIVPHLQKDPNLHNPQNHAQSIGRTATRLDLLERSQTDPGGIIYLKQAGGGMDQSYIGLGTDNIVLPRSPAHATGFQE